MDRLTLTQLLEAVRRGETPVEAALDRLRDWPLQELDFARLDRQRSLRCGFPEVIFGQGKTPQQIREIFRVCAAREEPVLVTRVAEETARLLTSDVPTAVHHAAARAVSFRPSRPSSSPGHNPGSRAAGQTSSPASPSRIGILAAGTADIPVAEEARVTAEIMDQSVFTLYDVGVAGLHRLLANLARLNEAEVLIVAAGMEGALPSVVGGLVHVPVIAVPTSVGYGAGSGGLAALLAMLNSCAAGVMVVNIDNGFGAGYAAATIGRLLSERREKNSP